MLVARVRVKAGAARRCFRCSPGYAINTKSRCWLGTHLSPTWAGQLDWLAGLRGIGIDEISYRKDQRSWVAEWAPRAVLCLDDFHVVAWATTALDEVCRAVAVALRRTRRIEQAATIKHTRPALLKTPESLSVDQRHWLPSRPPTARFTDSTCSKK